MGHPLPQPQLDAIAAAMRCDPGSQLSSWQPRYQLQRIGLFGSTARNEPTASSDVDVWVESA